MYFLFGNYGNNTIALIQWIFTQKLTPVSVINIDTGWGAAAWQEREAAGQRLATNYHFRTITLKPPVNFQELILDRNSFPTAKYQWCPTFLKALPFLSWLDEEDPRGEGTILLGSRREDSRTRANLPEFIEESEHYGGRKVWHPLYNLQQNERDALIEKAGFEVLPHRSLECAPCIHSSLNELKYIAPEQITRISELEEKLGETWFQSHHPGQSISSLFLEQESQSSTQINMGCGSYYACGD